mmetsp:Transcript_130640/g.254604  ORF Transcript_130640/g.254604 Transcript_130640/m.254604 type:complete len:191 (-) Transcript_130640:112-684(-)
MASGDTVEETPRPFVVKGETGTSSSPRPFVVKGETGTSFQPHEEHAKTTDESVTGRRAAAAAAAAKAEHQGNEDDKQKQEGDKEVNDGKEGKVGTQLGPKDGVLEVGDGQHRGLPLHEVLLRMSAVCNVAKQRDLQSCTSDKQSAQHGANELEVLRRECHLWRGECSRLWLQAQQLHNELKRAHGTCKEC